MNEKTIKSVLMLSNSFYPLPPGGAERQAEHLSAYLASKNIQVTVLTRLAPNLGKHEIKDGYKIVRIPEFGPGKIKTFTFVIGAMWKMIFNHKSFDLLHAHLVYSPAFAAAIVGKILGKKVIARFRSSGAGSDLINAQKSFRGLLRMAALKQWADCFIVLTKEMQDELIRAGYDPARIILMNNGVDTEYYAPAPAKIELQRGLGKEGKTILLYTGRLHESKNLPLLLHSLKKAIVQCPNLFLFMVGDGEERESLVNLTQKLNLQNHVSFVGSVPNVRDYLQIADIFVLSSFDEGISNSLLEAMSCGLACISTDVGGAKDLFDNGNCGLLVESNNVNDFTIAIIRLASDLQAVQQLGNLSRLRVLANYSIQAVGESYITLYNKVLNQR